MGKGAGSSAPAIEPVKPAAQVMQEAQSSTSRLERLRRSMAANFNRSSMSGYSPSTPTGGQAAKLGG